MFPWRAVETYHGLSPKQDLNPVLFLVVAVFRYQCPRWTYPPASARSSAQSESALPGWICALSPGRSFEPSRILVPIERALAVSVQGQFQMMLMRAALQSVAMLSATRRNSLVHDGMTESGKRREPLQVRVLPGVCRLSVQYSTPAASTIVLAT